MALYKYHYIELDTKRSPRISLQNIVAGETGNRLWITVTNNGETVDMSEKENNAWKYRVCLRIDSDLGTRRQDSAEENSGITFIDADTGDHGKINILLSKDSFTSGMNRAVLEIYSKRVNDNDTLICSAEFTFRAAKNPTGENAGTVYPSLIAYENDLRQLVSDAGDAIDDCEDATDAANDAADAANDAADAANAAAAKIKENGVSYLLTAMNVQYPDDHSVTCATEESYEDIMATHTDTTYRPLCIILDGYLLHEESYRKTGNSLTVFLKADADTGKTLSALLTAQQRPYGTTVGITATYDREKIFFLPLRNGVWSDGNLYADVDITPSALLDIMNYSRLAATVAAEDTDEIFTLYEAYRADDWSLIELRSAPDTDGNYMRAIVEPKSDSAVLVDAGMQKLFVLPPYSTADAGKYLHINATTLALEWATLPLYNGGVSGDE